MTHDPKAVADLYRHKKNKPMTIYEMCIESALQSPCQKMGFGAVAMMGGSTVAVTNNHPLEATAHVCEPECVRLGIKSRTESMIGACGHAEEFAIWETIEEYGTAEGLILYVAGVNAVGKPIENKDVSFSCIRCATTMNFAKIREVNIWFEDKWHALTPEEAYKSALEFALGKKEA